MSDILQPVTGMTSKLNFWPVCAATELPLPWLSWVKRYTDLNALRPFSLGSGHWKRISRPNRLSFASDKLAASLAATGMWVLRAQCPPGGAAGDDFARAKR